MTAGKQIRRAVHRGIALAGVFGIAACSSINPFSGPEASIPAPAAPMPAQPRVEAGDPLLRVVGTLPLRTDQSFQEPATGAVLRVEVVRAYEAASGRSCREYLVTDPAGRQESRVACRTGDRWVHARPLRLESAPGDAAAR